LCLNIAAVCLCLQTVLSDLQKGQYISQYWICCFGIAGTASLTCSVKKASVRPRRQKYPS
jgi:hypothetical protein